MADTAQQQQQQQAEAEAGAEAGAAGAEEDPLQALLSRAGGGAEGEEGEEEREEQVGEEEREALLRTVLAGDARTDAAALACREQAVYRLTRLLARQKRFQEIHPLVAGETGGEGEGEEGDAEHFFSLLAKAKVAKIVRSVLDIVAQEVESQQQKRNRGGDATGEGKMAVEGEQQQDEAAREEAAAGLETQVQLCKEVVEWCRREKRTFLRQRIETRLAGLLFRQKSYQEALLLVNTLLRELKKLDDKALLVETHLVESRIHHGLLNIAKSKAALTAARTACNAIYVVPTLQAELDEMSGTLHTEEADYGTAYSYFLEAFEAYDGGNDPRAMTCLKYMVLCKVLNNRVEDVPNIVQGKWGVKYQGPDLESMAAVARAAKERSLEEFQATVEEQGARLRDDTLIRHHLDQLYESMLDSNLLKIIQPYSCVEISHVAKLIKLPVDRVERKLSQMILDNKFYGILDQGRGRLMIYDEPLEDSTYTHGNKIITNMDRVVDALFTRSHALTHVES